MSASRQSSELFQRTESKVHEVWRKDATKFHQNMYESFCHEPNSTGYQLVPNEHLEDKIKIAIFGCDSSSKKYSDEEKKMISDLSECIIKNSPKFNDRFSLLAIVYVNVLLKNDNIENENHVVFRVPKLAKKENSLEEISEVNFPSESIIEIKQSQDSEACFIDIKCRVYKNWEDYKENNVLAEGRMCLPRDGIYKAGEDKKVLVDIMDTPACNKGALASMDATSSLLGVVGASVCVASAVTPVTACVVWGAFGLVTGSNMYTFGRSVGKLIDRRIHDQDLSPLNKDARQLWIDSLFSGTFSLIGGKVLSSGYLALRANGFKLSSSELAAVWSSNTSLIIGTSVNGVFKIIFTRVIDHVINGNWSDLKSFKNVCILFLNIFSPEEQIRKVLEDIATITKSIFNITSSVRYYLNWSFEKLRSSIERNARDLLHIAVIGAKFLYNVSLGLFDKRFTHIRDGIKGLLLGELSLPGFALKMVDSCEDIWSWFEESFDNAKQEYLELCNEENARNIIDKVHPNNGENLRKMFFELDNVIKVCEVANENKEQTKSLIKLVDDFCTKLGANCTSNQFLYSVKVVCASVVKNFKTKKNKYDAEYDSDKGLFEDDFDEDEFNEKFGVEEGVDVATYFFTEVLKKMHDENELSKMFALFEKMSNNANKSVPSIQAENIKQYLFIDPSGVTNVNQIGMWQDLFKTLTGIPIDNKNVDMVQKDNIVSIVPRAQNSNFKYAFFFIKEEKPELKCMLSVYTTKKEN